MKTIELIKAFLAAIRVVEQLMPQSPGKEKFDAAVAIVEDALGSVQDKIPALQSLATLAVNALRATGVFKAKTT